MAKNTWIVIALCKALFELVTLNVLRFWNIETKCWHVYTLGDEVNAKMQLPLNWIIAIWAKETLITRKETNNKENKCKNKL